MEGEKIEIAQRTFEFAVRVVKLCNVLDENPGTTRTLANQLLKSGTSIGANVAEAQSAQSRKDFISKLEIALKQTRETHYWLKFLVAADLIKPPRLQPLIDENEVIIKILVKIVTNTKRNSSLNSSL